MALKRALRNRSVSVPHSLSHRAPEDKLIPLKLWQRSHGRFIRDLNLPASPEKYLQRLEAGLTAGLAAMAEAVEAGTVAIDGWSTDSVTLIPPVGAGLSSVTVLLVVEKPPTTVVGDKVSRLQVSSAAQRAEDRLRIPVQTVVVTNARWAGASDPLIAQVKASPLFAAFDRDAATAEAVG